MTTVHLNPTPLVKSKPLTVRDVKPGRWFRIGESLYIRRTQYLVGERTGWVKVWDIDEAWVDEYRESAVVDEILPPDVTVAWKRNNP